jgi:hypothetical protein
MSLVGHSLHDSSKTRLVRTKLQIEGRAREFALLNLAMASFAAVTSLSSVSKMSLACGTRQIGQPSGKRKLGRPVRFELSEQTRPDSYLRSCPLPSAVPTQTCRRAI